MRNRISKKLTEGLAFLLAGALLTGCGQPGAGGQENGEPVQNMETGGQEKAMGRYLEKEIPFPEEITAMGEYPQLYLQKLESGELELVEVFAGKYISGDMGETWEHEALPWLSELAENAYIGHMALAPNGGAAVIYDSYPEEIGTGEEWDEKYEPKYLFADPQGNTHDIEFQAGEDRLHRFWFGKDSSLYAYSMEHNVYEVDTETGALEKLFDTEGLADYVCFTEKYMVVITSRGIVLYNLEEGSVAEEDRTLQDFVMKNAADTIGSSTDGYALVAAEGEQEDVIYLAFSGGLYRHVIGGTTMEQVVDGNISSLGDPMMLPRGMELLPENEFAVLYDDGKLYRYVYDPDVPTVPEEQLSIYSLFEDDTIRQAVSLFRKQNPDIYIRYEVGMTGDNGMIEEDAIKNLNTKLMSGSGPDLLVLDGLPADSYKEKGILTDLTALEAGMSGEDRLFSNLVDACREDGKLYALPVRFCLPVLAGEEAWAEKITDLKTLADAVEQLRRENPEGSLLGFYSEKEALNTLGMVSSASWMNGEGEIDQEKLTEFLFQARRIYEAETAGLDLAELEEYEKNNQENDSEEMDGKGGYSGNVSSGALGIAMGVQKAALGKIGQFSFDYNMLSTLAEEQEDFVFAPWAGQISRGFLPSALVGISAGSAENEKALDFYRFLFGRELQDLDLPGGFPVNMASFDSFAEDPNGDGMNGGLALSVSGGGNEFMLDIRWADKDEFKKLKSMAQSVSAVSTGNSIIEQAVYEIGPEALNGSCSVEEAVEKIVRKAAIYLAE